MASDVSDATAYANWTDERLAEEYRDRPGDAVFAEIVRRYQRPVFRLALSILGQEFAADAEDVAQEVMVRVHHGLRTFRGDAKVGTWIYRITFNLSLTVKQRTRFRVPHASDQALERVHSGERSPDAQLEDRRTQAELLACIAGLPEVYQTALRLHYWLGTSVRDVAVMLDVPENTVKSYLFRARQLLRAQLSARGLHGR